MAATFTSGLDPTTADKIEVVSVPRRYPPRSFIFYEGDPAGGAFLVETGLLRIDRSTASGRIALLDLAIEGDMIGELSVIDNSPRSATLSTVTECVVRYVSAENLRALIASDPTLQHAVMQRLAHRIRALSTQFLETATLNAPAKIASCLVRLVEIEETLGRLEKATHGRSVNLRMLISQEELGQWAGLGREGAVKGLSALRTLGLIETARMRVHIGDIEALRSFRDSAES